jgi:uncharacterized protein with HEPN domain
VNKHAFRVEDYLLHMLEAADRVLAYTAGVTKDQFLAAPMIQDATIRNIEIIGEAANNLLQADPEFAEQHPSIPFEQIYGMRNRVAHGYFAVSAEMVWETVAADIPELRAEILRALSDLRGNA